MFIKKIVSGFLILLWSINSASNAFATVYYVDANRTDSSGNGQSWANAWRYCPGSQGAVGSTSGWVTISAGDTIVFDGGDKWNRPVNISSSWFRQPSDENGRITLTTDTQSVSDRAVIDLTGVSGYSSIVDVNRNFITIEYFEIANLTHSSESRGIGVYDDTDVKILYTHVHDIINDNGPASYAISGSYCDRLEIGYSILEDAQEKILQLYKSVDDIRIHHNVFRMNSDFDGYDGKGTDHGFTLTWNSTGGLIYNNIFECNKTPRTDPSFAFKLDGASNSYPDGNKFYNNIITKWQGGVGLIESGDNLGNEIVGNTIYLQNYSGGASGSYGLFGISLCMESSSQSCKNNVVKNNIVYNVKTNNDGGGTHMNGMSLQSSTPSVSGNEIENNLFFHYTANTRFRVGGTANLTMSYVEANWHGTNGNKFKNNIIAEPGFSGGSPFVNNLPTGFDTYWNPNGDGLSITLDSAARDTGAMLNGFYDRDVLGVSRPEGSAMDIGAYEFSEGSPNVAPHPPTGLRIVVE